MYAVPASKCDGSIFEITAIGGSPAMFFVTSVQWGDAASESRVYQTLPSLVPAHTSPRWISEGAMANTTSP